MKIAWPLIILVALAGWGYAGAWVARRIGGVELSSFGEVFAIGIAVVLAIAGVIVAFGSFSSVVVYGGSAVGVAFALVELVRRVRAGLTRREFLDVPFGLLMIATIFLLALWGIAHFRWNPCDDDAAYLYFAKRLVIVGDLLDPMNNRRLTSLGGMSALQAIFLVRLPDWLLPLADLFLGPLLILFGLWRSRWGRWSVWGIAATFLIVLFPANLGGLTNTSPIFIPLGLGIAACSVALEMRVKGTTARGRIMYACLLGLLVGSAGTLRPQFGVPFGLVAIAMVCWPPFERGTVQRLAGLAAGLGIVLGGWAAASWRAVGTPMFPLLSGNLDPTWPSTNPPGTAPSWADFISGLAPPFLNPPWAIAMLLAVGVPVFVLTRAEVEEKYRRWGLRLQVIVAAAAVVLVVILVRLYWAAGPASGYPRFWAPVIMTAILMPLVLINRTRGERSSAASLGGVAIFVVVGLALSANPMDGWQELRSVAEDTRTRTVIQSPDRYASVRAEYAQAAAMIPAGSKVLAAVDVPSLLLSRTYELNTLDIAGSTSPSPHLPYFRGTGAKLAWLRSHGYSYVVAVEPSASDCLYNRRLQTEDINGEHGRVYQAWAPYFFDWFDFLASVPDSTRVGDLIVVKL